MASRLLGRLPPPALEDISRYLVSEQVRAGDILAPHGEPSGQVWFPLTCVAAAVVAVPPGRAIEVGKIGAEGMAGCGLVLGGAGTNMSVIVQLGGEALRMSAADFHAHVAGRQPEVYDVLLQYCDAFYACVAQLAACNSLHSIDQRLARWILTTADRSCVTVMPLTQEYIASMLGIRRASVSTAASALQQLGAIQYTRGEIEVIDRFTLEQQSCSCYRVLNSLCELHDKL